MPGSALALLVSATQVSESTAKVVDDLVGAHEQVEDVRHHFNLLIVLVCVAVLPHLIAAANVLNEEGAINAVDDLWCS